MANFPKMQLTSKGLELLTNVQAGADTLTFTKTALGDGVISVPISTLTALVSSKAEIPISEGKTVGNNTYQIGAFFNNTEIATGFWWREIGVFAKGNNGKEILYCYSNAGDAGDYIPVGSDERIEKYIYQSLAIGNATNVTAEINGNDSFVPNADKGKPNGVAPLGADGKIPSEYINMDLSELEKFVSDVDNALIEHKDDKSNPHGVNATDVGLGNVPNVATNDQTPTYTESSSLTGLTSGEKLGIAFGKIKKAITELISHLADTTKHITATERTSWNSKAPQSHASTSTTYGVGTASNYGHLKITDSLNNASTDTAASAKALKAVNDKVTVEGYTLLKTQVINTTVANPGQQMKTNFQLTGFDFTAYTDYKIVLNGTVTAQSTSGKDTTSGSAKIGIYPIAYPEATTVTGEFIGMTFTLTKNEIATTELKDYRQYYFKNISALLNYKNGTTVKSELAYTFSGASFGRMSESNELYCYFYSTGTVNYTVNLTFDIYGKGALS